jgi:hypothetical protein
MIEQTGEIWGGSANWGGPPRVQAHSGPLPKGASGIEFYTDVAPDPDTPKQWSYWTAPRAGVREEDGFAKICCTITKNTQK